MAQTSFPNMHQSKKTHLTLSNYYFENDCNLTWSIKFYYLLKLISRGVSSPYSRNLLTTKNTKIYLYNEHSEYIKYSKILIFKKGYKFIFIKIDYQY